MKDKEQSRGPSGAALLERIAELALEKRGHDLVALDVRQQVYYTDYFLLVTGRTELHVNTLRRHLEKVLAEEGVKLILLEGEDHNRWVLMDYGPVIVHLFFEPLRDLYELEKLWAEAPQIDLSGLAGAQGHDEEDDGDDDEGEDLFADFD